MDGYDWAALLTGPKVVRIFMGRAPLEQERRGGSLLQLDVAIRLNSPVGEGGRWEADVDTDVDVLFTVLHCSMYCLQCGV